MKKKKNKCCQVCSKKAEKWLIYGKNLSNAREKKLCSTVRKILTSVNKNINVR